MDDKLSQLKRFRILADEKYRDLERRIKREMRDAEYRIRESHKEEHRVALQELNDAHAAYNREERRRKQVQAGYEEGLRMLHPAQPHVWSHTRRLYGVIEIWSEDSLRSESSTMTTPRKGTMVVRLMKVNGEPSKVFHMADWNGLFEGWRPATDSEWPKIKQKRRRGPYKKRPKPAFAVGHTAQATETIQ